MKLRPFAPILLLLALAGCSEDAPQRNAKTAAAHHAEAKKQETEAAAVLGKEKADLSEQAAGRSINFKTSGQLMVEEDRSANVQGAAAAPVLEAEPASSYEKKMTEELDAPMPTRPLASPPAQWSAESYKEVVESGFIRTAAKPLSTFSIDVDTASYSNVRRFITEGQLPPKNAVRIEELINYFSYSYPQPEGGHPFSVTTELGPCPWHSKHKLARIGLKAKDIAKHDLPPSNLVFLIDVSGSMADPNKLPLLQQAMKLLVMQLGKDDRVSIVVYAGSDSVALDPTPGSEQQKIITAVNSLGAGGSTHASSGIVTAYQLAGQNFMPGGNNRVILASDGDFNVGLTSLDELKRLIEEKRKSGVYLTVLGFGMGNYHDDTMEVLADKGNGNYAYIDSLLEAKKVMVKEMSGTLFALAKDVKIQVEFNPAKVGAYRLIGYENRALADEDFNDDRKDAGEIGVGHTVTALYELIPAGTEIDPLKYQRPEQKSAAADPAYANELMTVKLRYKPLAAQESVLLDTAVQDSDAALADTSADFRFAAAVAGWGMLLNGSEQAGGLNWQQIAHLAKNARGQDEEGYKAEFIRLVEAAELLVK